MAPAGDGERLQCINYLRLHKEKAGEGLCRFLIAILGSPDAIGRSQQGN
jgi:hypothetical protein